MFMVLRSPRQQSSVLVTGFDPFGGASTNASWLAVRALSGCVIDGHPVITAELPTVFAQAWPQLKRLMDEHRPRLVLAVGEAAGRSSISLERVALNLCDARIPDNAGAQPVEQPVDAAGPAAYSSRLPLRAVKAELDALGIPAEISNTAGTFVCNQVFYQLMQALDGDPGGRGGFIHVPLCAEYPRPGLPSVPLEVLKQALYLIVKTALRLDNGGQISSSEREVSL